MDRLKHQNKAARDVLNFLVSKRKINRWHREGSGEWVIFETRNGTPQVFTNARDVLDYVKGFI
ncbi:hypothetical protein [Thalassobacillus pellis]|uniref:hypothetical protein n=1 Tax=Thalassobacillus pellis TaxID=748008 RepID=UPI001960A163|nr:hypothetical protein [Thalassobacillus pellis]MBM7554553.1 hypothetical protein [Thalassobacillus pellis]